MPPIAKRPDVPLALPPRLGALERLAYNLRWAWAPGARALFEQISPERFAESGNPVRVLCEAPARRLEALAADEAFVRAVAAEAAALDEYLGAPADGHDTVAYFCAEYGLCECVPFYAGGLGVLAGDHLKAASDLRLPLVAVGLAYHEGYLSQSLGADGGQVERFPSVDFRLLPMRPVRRPSSETLLVVPIAAGDRTVRARVWRLDVGRVALYLLDTDLPQNTPADRQITRRLYGGDRETRILQEMVLGIGGLRALEALGIDPAVCHLNEGHAGFLGLEQARQVMARHEVSYEEARLLVSARNVFTTHTPIPAGFDEFSRELVQTHLHPMARALGISDEALLRLGQRDDAPSDAPFNMAVLAMRHASLRNGVSRLHGEVSRQLFSPLYPALPVEEVPVDSVTNGVHYDTWVGPEVRALFAAYCPDALASPADAGAWANATAIPDQALWAARLRQRARLGELVATRGSHALDPNALLIGFARRFTAYKRADLILADAERLAQLLSGPRPVQLVYAGKAHPMDAEGKKILRRIGALAREGKVIFLEDYDLEIGRLITQGVDVWLNNPRRPLEASGTSGMKVALNGGLNLSVLDGWWDECFAPGIGWAIGDREPAASPEAQDAREGAELHRLLIEELLPTFWTRDAFGIPHAWVQMIKRAFTILGPRLSSTRMVAEYRTRFYGAAAARGARLEAGGIGRLVEVASYRTRVTAAFAEVEVSRVQTYGAAGGRPTVEAFVRLQTLSPRDVRVELVCGTSPMPMRLTGFVGGEHRFEHAAPAGGAPVRVRVVPSHPEVLVPNELPLCAWSDEPLPARSGGRKAGALLAEV